MTRAVDMANPPSPQQQSHGDNESLGIASIEIFRSNSELKRELKRLVHLIPDEEDCRTEVLDEISCILATLRNRKLRFQKDKSENNSKSFSEKLDAIGVPDCFLCPISSKLIRDPVVVATGQTYDRKFIQAWLDAGHRTCPKTQQILPHFILTPNYLLGMMIQQWCEGHGLELPINTADVTNSVTITPKEKKYVATLVDELSGDYQSQRREAARELRALTRKQPSYRAYIGEAHIIPTLITLLLSPDLETQEHVVTTVLNLSIHEANKSLIAEEGGIPPIVEVLRSGNMAARENAAAALFSLSAVDENKAQIGACGAIPPLVELLRDGNTRGKKDAASALFNLCIYPPANRSRSVRAGLVPVLLEFMSSPAEAMGDESLAILTILSSHEEGAKAIGDAGALPLLMEYIKAEGCPRNRENAVIILSALCSNDPRYLKEVKNSDRGTGYKQALIDLSLTGTSRARRKASALIDRIQRYQRQITM